MHIAKDWQLEPTLGNQHSSSKVWCDHSHMQAFPSYWKLGGRIKGQNLKPYIATTDLPVGGSTRFSMDLRTFRTEHKVL